MSDMPTFYYGETPLTASLALRLSRKTIRGEISAQSREKIRASAQEVAKIVDRAAPVYGINTGFGPLCTQHISADQARKLQENLLKSHAVGMGPAIAEETARLMLILKLQALAKGYSGIQESTLDRMLWHLEQGLIPVVPQQGSVGASGDLAPLAHLFLPLIGEGQLLVNGRIRPAAEVLQERGVAPLVLGPKEGLALINGTQFIAAYAVQVLERMQKLLDYADLIGAMMLEGLMGAVTPFRPELHALRPFKGCQHVAHQLSQFLADSEIVASHRDCARVQDPYSLRCMPQVHGASRNAWLHLKELVAVELNGVTDNPIVLSAEEALSGGNFHGQPLAMALDYACLAAAELGSISDRRIYLALSGDTPGVPKLLLKETGLNSGFMIVQYTSAALVSENKGLCFPASADSIPTSLGQEDHVSMGSISARKALQVIENVEKVLAIELFCAAQALDFHQPLRAGMPIGLAHQAFREQVPGIQSDQVLHGFLEQSLDLLRKGQVWAPVAAFLREEAGEKASPWAAEFGDY
ncbi:MAG: histidine ammonia-lyase [Nitritalea sp.]